MDSNFKCDIRTELLAEGLAQLLCAQLNNMDFDVNKIVGSTAVKVLSEIHEVLGRTDLSDFEAIDMIVCIFNKYNLNSGRIHEMLD